MKTSIMSPNIQLNNMLLRAAEQRLSVVLGRISDRIHQVSITVTDDNGLKGGIDKRCRAKVSLQGEGEITTEGRHTSVLASIDQAIRRARRVILKRLKRQATRSRKQPDILVETDDDSPDEILS